MKGNEGSRIIQPGQMPGQPDPRMLEQLMKRKQLQEAMSQIDWATQPSQPCSCGNEYFDHKYKLKLMSAELAPDGIPRTVPVPVFVCDKCGNEMTPGTKTGKGSEEKPSDDVTVHGSHRSL